MGVDTKLAKRKKRHTPTHATRRRQMAARQLAEAAEHTHQAPLADEVHSTAAFEAFYKAQGIVPPSEWDALLAALHRPLPVTFRFSAYPGSARTVSGYREQWRQLRESFPGCHTTPLPVAGAWQLPYDRATLSARESTVTREIHKWLGGACAVGAAQRQELVSMVPVALLDVQPHHLCLDCCASPGSKTTQLLELVSGAGAVVANDMKPVRAFTLSKRCRALGLASSRLAVVTHRAQALPSLIGAGCGDGAARRGYDRIVCDVPCTGDGAIRKAPELWRYWSPHLGRQLHSLQLQLALRAAHLLAPGGVMAYSTCSLNPLENEAVVVALLQRSSGELELLPTAHLLPELQRRPGLTTWAVFDDRMRRLHSFGQSQRKRVSKGLRRCFRATMWPPAGSAEGADAIRSVLPRCMRLVPHLHDSGGFFVALIRRCTSAPRPPRAPSRALSPPSAGRQYRPVSPEACRMLTSSLGLSAAEHHTFVRVIGRRLHADDSHAVARIGGGGYDDDGDEDGALDEKDDDDEHEHEQEQAAEPHAPRTIVVLSETTAAVLADARPAFRPVCAGARVFVRFPGGKYQLVQDGAALLLPALPPRCVAKLPWAELVAVLQCHVRGEALGLPRGLQESVCLLGSDDGREGSDEALVACCVSAVEADGQTRARLRLLASKQQVSAVLAAMGA